MDITKISFYCFLCLFMATLIGCNAISSPGSGDPSVIVQELFDSFHEGKVRFNPLEATKAGDYRFNDRLPNFISDQYQEEQRQFYQDHLQNILELDTSGLNQQQVISLEVMKWECQLKLEGLGNELVSITSPLFELPAFELMPVFQISCLHLYIGQLAGGKSVQPFDTPKQYEDWLQRLRELVIYLDTAIVKMREGIGQRVVLPRVLIERSIDQLKPFTRLPVTNNLFYAPVDHFPDNFTEKQKNELGTAYREFIENELAPAFARLESFLRIEYLPNGRTTDGLWAIPGGKEAYDYLIRYHTTTSLTAEEIHELGKREVARIANEMEAIKREMGYQGDLTSFFEFVRTNPEYMPFKRPEDVIDHFNDIRKRVEPNTERLFDLKPKADFVVRRTEAFREAAAAAEFVPGTKDGSRPGTFYVPIPDVTKYNLFADEALFLHEAIPGHYYQLSLQQENEELPAFQHAEGMGVFVEGWALYAESLGSEMGLYTDPIQKFGMLSMEMHRAIRLVVDTGIHALRWSRADAINYSLENEAESAQAITSEIERYMAVPAQALSYKIGQLKIRELRDKAQTDLGAQFDIRDFHNQVLNTGSLPMDLLESKINKWITEAKK